MRKLLTTLAFCFIPVALHAQIGGGAREHFFDPVTNSTITPSSIVLGGSSGTITSGSSVTASGFFGSGAALTNLPSATAPNVGALSGWTATTSGGAGITTSTEPATITSTLTIQGNAFSVGASTFVVAGSSVGVGTSSPTSLLHVSSGNIVVNGLGFGGVVLSTLQFTNYVASQTIPYIGLNVSTLTRIASMSQNVTSPICVGTAPITIIDVRGDGKNYIEASGIAAFAGTAGDLIRSAWLLDGKCNETTGVGGNACAEQQMQQPATGYNGIADRMVFSNVSAGLHWVCFAWWAANDTMGPLNFTVRQLQ